jgi:orotate phosphoribosyltransferase
MRPENVLQLLESVGAIRQGHFELSSGLHSDTYVQCALVLQYPNYAEQLGAALAAEFTGLVIEAVVSPALGGVILGHEVARALGKSGQGRGVPALFVERDSSGTMCLRRGFSIEPGQRVLVVEDVWTTGGSTFEAIRVVEEAGGLVVGAGALIDRSGATIEFPVTAEALVQLHISNYEPAICPLCRAGGAAIKPGSRFVRVAR